MLHSAIDYYLDRRIDRIFKRVESGGLAGVVGFFRTFAQVCREQPERAATGCLVVNSAVELGYSDPGVARLADRYRRRVRGAFRSALEQAAKDGQIEGDIGPLRDLAFLMLMGLFVSVKGGAPLEEIERLCAVAIHTVVSWHVPPEPSAVERASDSAVPTGVVQSERNTP